MCQAGRRAGPVIVISGCRQRPTASLLAGAAGRERLAVPEQGRGVPGVHPQLVPAGSGALLPGEQGPCMRLVLSCSHERGGDSSLNHLKHVDCSATTSWLLRIQVTSSVVVWLETEEEIEGDTERQTGEETQTDTEIQKR